MSAASKFTTMVGGICCVPTAFFMILRTILYFTNPEKQIKNTVESKTRTNIITRLAPENGLLGLSNSIIKVV
ncbi:hypothetical protein VSA01S_35760 [Vibrio sagamiensis NBRC 104589]|uniref:Uncharacterized protein n=1 Tax=Vibrio sagamiensis NBRC 104589 TaxID=1219064 RepID=A0A511QJF9_9VIBR|nr:hypothetical protein VSA01S_35760 [Vibrio sagamiensis NBRC 104589]